MPRALAERHESGAFDRQEHDPFRSALRNDEEPTPFTRLELPKVASFGVYISTGIAKPPCVVVPRLTLTGWVQSHAVNSARKRGIIYLG
jgi:hypothetical protein